MSVRFLFGAVAAATLTIDDDEYVDEDGDMDEGDIANEELALNKGSLSVNSNKWAAVLDEDEDDDDDGVLSFLFRELATVLLFTPFLVRGGDDVSALVSSSAFLLFFLGDFIFYEEMWRELLFVVVVVFFLFIDCFVCAFNINKSSE